MHRLRSFLILWVLFVQGIVVHGQETIIFNPAATGQYIGRNIAIFKDTTAKLGFREVEQNPALFQLQSEIVPNLGVTHDNNWLKFSVVNNDTEGKILMNIEYPSIDEITLYVVKDSVVIKKEVTTIRNFASRFYNHQFYIFEIPLDKGVPVTCYVKLVGNTQLLAPITLNTNNSILNVITDSEILSGMYIGIMLAMILYNLFIYFSSKDISYLFYVNYIFWVALAQITLLGYSARFLWPSNTWLIENAMLLTAALSGIGTILFVKKFLDTRVYAPRFNILLTIVLVAEIVCIVLLLSGYDLLSYKIINSIAGIGAVVIFITALLILAKKRKPAVFFLLAWSIFLISVVVFVLKDFGLFKYNFVTTHAMQIGSAIEAVLLSFALADSINVLKKEKDQSRLAALRIAKENGRIIKEQNVLLEIKVNERTEELVAKNDELNQTLADLQQAQMKLVESEKMASLGQLTAGIAHEINNPINFVTGNIGPLKRDIEVLFTTIDLIESYHTKDMPTEVKLREIADFKEDQDFDYLKKEIGHLLKGINEGAGRTAEIVKSLRIFSRLDEDVLKLADINEGLESTLIIVNNLLGEIRVARKYGDIPFLNCYPGKLNQVFLNIISNALFAIREKFQDQPGGELTVETYSDDVFVGILIKDNGIGMTEEIKRKMFDPFYTTKDVGQGTGLGMSIAFNTIQKHNGEINVNTALGEGSSFELKIPIHMGE